MPDRLRPGDAGYGAALEAAALSTQRRIDAAVALLREVPSQGSYGCGDTCHHDHADCLAARTIAILTGEDHHA